MPVNAGQSQLSVDVNTVLVMLFKHYIPLNQNLEAMKKSFLFLTLLVLHTSIVRSQVVPDATKGPEVLNIIQSVDSVGLYDKFEARLVIRAKFVNPFDPDDIDIMATFTSPSGKQWNIPGFYNYTFGTMWKVRFSPDELGKWKYSVRVRDKSGEDVSEEKSFKTIPSRYKGPLKISDNKRFLEYKNGSPFYGVGLWYNGRVTQESLDELKGKGVNFISNFITPLETMGSGVGRYDQDICMRIDEMFELCEEKEILISLNLWFHSFLSETVWGGFNIRWHTNPYQHITSAKDFYRSTTAWNYQEKLYRYFIARWGYSRSLAIWFIVDEINGTDGWVSGDSVMAGQWTKNVHAYFKAHDPYNHPTTGTRSGGIKEFFHEGYQETDIAAREIYEAQGFPMPKPGTLDSADIHPLTYSYKNYAGQIRRIWHGYKKPVIIGETGWDHTYFEPGMPGYVAMHHNVLWVSLATGSCMTPFWWAFSGRMNDVIVSNQLLNVRRFTDAIPFSKLSNLTPIEVIIPDGDGYGIQSDNLVYGWVVNSRTDVAGDLVTIKTIKDGKYKLKLFHTWRGAFIQESEVLASNNTVTFSVPSLKTTGGHSNYIGQDVAFILEPVKVVSPAAGSKKTKTKN
jgi:Domain of unknown function (DUF5060)